MRLVPWRSFARCLALSAILTTPAGAVEDRQESDGGVPYEVVVQIDGEDRIKQLFEASSLLLELAKRPPSSRRGLERRIDEDRDRLDRIMRAEGYYAAEIEIRIKREALVEIYIVAQPGMVYRLGEFDVVVAGCAADACAPRPGEEAHGLRLGQPARAAEIVEARNVTRRWYRARGHPFIEVGELAVTVDHDNFGVFVELPMKPGPRRTFGPLRFRRTAGVDQSYLSRLLTWRVGELYDRRKQEAYARALRETGLFASVDVSLAADDAADAAGGGPIPIDVDLTSAKRRSIGAGVDFSTSEGPGGHVFWEHRNYFGANENFRVSADASLLRQALELSMRKPAFLYSDHALSAGITIEREDLDAFNRQGVEGEIAVERQATPEITTSLGLLGEASRIDDQGGRETSLIAGLPASFVRDARSDALDPRSGYRYALRATPFAGVHRGPLAFARLEASGSTYYEPIDEGGLVLAVRGRVGSLPGPATERIPATRRFFAGGGSVRGYAFEAIGPLDDEGDPLGGRTLVEVSGEARMRIFGDFGVVAFIDGGNVYDELLPGLDRPMRWGAGIGGRYFTAVGPLRFDIAVPLNPRRGDDVFQFYISLGQAF